jgi:hypothetical protein
MHSRQDYRDRVKRVRKLATSITADKLREQLEGLARQYEKIALSSTYDSSRSPAGRGRLSAGCPSADILARWRGRGAGNDDDPFTDVQFLIVYDLLNDPGESVWGNGRPNRDLTGWAAERAESRPEIRFTDLFLEVTSANFSFLNLFRNRRQAVSCSGGSIKDWIA